MGVVVTLIVIVCFLAGIYVGYKWCESNGDVAEAEKVRNYFKPGGEGRKWFWYHVSRETADALADKMITRPWQ